mmetsp:Transcript_8542/g.17185  ORF Transcript_8542/g.17185 Transcript_8542/m.17185 type:complete len:225 (-) Transcript_8542:1308-1982(-)
MACWYQDGAGGRQPRVSRGGLDFGGLDFHGLCRRQGVLRDVAQQRLALINEVHRRRADDVDLKLGLVLVSLDLAAQRHHVALPLRTVDDRLVCLLVVLLDGLELSGLHADELLGNVVESGDPLVGAAVASHARQHVSVDATGAAPAAPFAVEAGAVIADDLPRARWARRVPDGRLVLGRWVDLRERRVHVEVRRLLAGADAWLLQVQQTSAGRIAVRRVAAGGH